jgi:excisionase family DNA binding protein
MHKRDFCNTVAPSALNLPTCDPLPNGNSSGRPAQLDPAFEARVEAVLITRADAFLERLAAAVDERLRAISTQRPRMLFKLKEAAQVIGCGHSKLYELINSGALDVRRLGKRSYITAASLESFVERLPRAVTPTIAKAEHDSWAGHHAPKTPNPTTKVSK